MAPMVGITVLIMDDGGMSGSRFTKSICGSLWLLHDLLPGRDIWKGTFLSVSTNHTHEGSPSISRVDIPLALHTRVSGHLAIKRDSGVPSFGTGQLL